MFCPKCGTQNIDGAVICVKCNANFQNPNTIIDSIDSSNVASIIPIGRTGLSILAGYLGLFSIIPIVAPLSLTVSIFALRQLKQNPAKLGKGRAIFGLIMGILGTLILIFLILSSFIKK